MDAEADGASREGRTTRGREKEDNQQAWSYHSTVMSGNISHAVRSATNRKGGGCLLPDDQCTKTGRPVVEVLQEKHPNMKVTPPKKPCVQPLNNTRKCLKWYPLISRRMTSHGLYQSFPEPQARWELRRLIWVNVSLSLIFCFSS